MRKERNSSVELFRILITLGVLVLHFSGWFLGGLPESFDYDCVTPFTVGQLVIVSLSVVCVNCFILISGFFGIKLSARSLYRFLLMLIGMYVPMAIINMIYTGVADYRQLIGGFLPISRGGYFVVGYFMLMILSPVMNSFIESVPRKKLLLTTLLLLLIEFYFGCVRDIEWFGINGGYSVIHFCVMYLCGRTICLYKDVLTRMNNMVWVSAYFLFTIATIGLYLLGIPFSHDYSSPFVILASVCCFVPFLSKEYVNSTVNWIAKGTFAVYILQITEPLYSLLVNTDKYLLSSYRYGVYLLLSLLVIIAVFTACVLYDKVREKFTGLFSERVYGLLSRFFKKWGIS